MTTLICQFNIDSRIFICPVRVPYRYEENLRIYVEKLQEHDVTALYYTKSDVMTVNPVRGGPDMASFPGVRALDMSVITPWIEGMFKRLGMTRAECLTAGLGNDADKIVREQSRAETALAGMQMLFGLLDYTDNTYMHQLTTHAEHAGSMQVRKANQTAQTMDKP